MLQLTVIDTGPGLSARQIGRITGEPQMDADHQPELTRKPGSESIGVSIVTQLCTKLGGTLDLKVRQEKARDSLFANGAELLESIGSSTRLDELCRRSFYSISICHKFSIS